MWHRGLGFRVNKKEKHQKTKKENTRSCLAFGASECHQTVRILTPDRRLKGWHLLPPFRSLSATVLPSRSRLVRQSELRPSVCLRVQVRTAVHGDAARRWWWSPLSAACYAHLSHCWRGRGKYCQPSRLAESLSRSPSLSFRALHCIAPSLRHFPSLSLSLNPHPPTRSLFFLLIQSCHLRTIASFIHYALPERSTFISCKHLFQTRGRVDDFLLTFSSVNSNCATVSLHI